MREIVEVGSLVAALLCLVTGLFFYIRGRTDQATFFMALATVNMLGARP